MTSFLVNAVLFTALVATSVLVVGMHRRLKRFEFLQQDFGSALRTASEALTQANSDMTNLNAEAKQTLVQLSAKIEEAKRLIPQI
jgi:hypothetical protein